MREKNPSVVQRERKNKRSGNGVRQKNDKKAIQEEKNGAEEYDH